MAYDDTDAKKRHGDEVEEVSPDAIEEAMEAEDEEDEGVDFTADEKDEY